jgi:nitrogen fixation NifU-like protein
MVDVYRNIYSKKVMQHFLHPKNMGEMENPDAEGRAGNPICGDMMTLQLKIKNDRIVDIKFRTLGCAAAIATSSMITELAKGKTLSEAMKITRADVSKELGGLPPIKEHCSNLAADALHNAIENYLKSKSKANKKQKQIKTQKNQKEKSKGKAKKEKRT